MTEPLGRDLSELVDPAAYANGYPHRIWTLLRRESPVAWCEIPEVRPFWAITKHADILRISREPATFSSTGRLAIGPGDAALPDDGPPFRHLLQMDPPEHGKYRRLVSGRFTPRSLATLEPHLVAIAREIVDDVASTVVQDAAESGELDFVESIAARLPLAVICEMLGVPRDDWDLIFHLTNEHLGAADPEYHVDGESPAETSDRARRDLFDYFTVLARARGSPPGDDLVSVLAEAQIDDAPVPQFELLSYLLLLIVAGNETTRNATTGGMLAFLEHPEEWQRLRQEQALLPTAIEEVLRWTSPVIQFARTATADVELRGVRIRAGDTLALWFPSANRDEDVFDQPFTFAIDRAENSHLAFGIGEHHCLGSNLARLELAAIFRQLLERVRHMELAGEVSRLHSSFVGGIKELPVRMEFAAAD